MINSEIKKERLFLEPFFLFLDKTKKGEICIRFLKILFLIQLTIAG
jgi:hypothetical protein